MMNTITPARWSLLARIRGLLLYKLGKMIISIFFRTHISGRKNIPKEGVGTLFASNHLSHIDSLILGITIFPKKKIVHFMAAKDWMDLWYFGWIRMFGAFPVGRGPNEREKTIKNAVLLLKDNSSVFIFPEGERSRTGRWSGAKIGVGWIAHSAGINIKVIPIYISGSQYILPPGRIFPNLRTKIFISFGPPVDLTEHYSKEISPNNSLVITNEIVNGIIKQKDRFIEAYSVDK